MSFSVRGPQGLRGALLACSLSASAVAEVLPFATAVVEYVPGIGAAAGYQNPQSALGWPERFTGEGLYPGVVSPFSSPWLSHEVVSIGLGGRLTLELGEDIVDDPANPYGIDFIVFGNAFFWDLAWPLGVAGQLYAEGGPISVSEDGLNFIPVPGAVADGAMPTLGYLDVGPYSEVPGEVESDFRMPFDPKLAKSPMAGLSFEELRELYGASGGGHGVDIAATGLARVRFVRIEGPAGSGSTEVDALTVVAPPLVADLDDDGLVGPGDLAILLGNWGATGKPGTPVGDLDGDGAVGAGDLTRLLGSWS
jgi:hypothetical protein